VIQERLQRWIMELPDGPEIEAVNQHVVQLARELYSEYEPTKGPSPDFWQRLEMWLDNVTEADQKVLFRLLRHLFFIGPKELDNLYRVAYNEHVSRWLIDQIGASLDDPTLDTQLSTALQETWFCPVTDSMRINAFYHLNHITGSNFRPDWASLCELGSTVRIDAYIAKHGIKRLVLLEDFVGSGSQINDAVVFAATLPSRLPVLCLPLILCPNGRINMALWESTHTNLTCDAVLNLRSLDFLTPTAEATEPVVYAQARTVAVTAYNAMQASGPHTQLYSAFGYQETGGLVVLSTNCPDNTLPLIHFNVPTWNALFPRASRL
jgi:hypothetical protein